MVKVSDGMKKKLKILGVTLFVLYIFILCLLWLIKIDYNHAPDERMKYDICKYLMENGKLPHGGDESLRDEKWGISYGFTPILSYMISAIFMKLVSFITSNSFTIFLASRFTSVLCLTGFTIMCYKIASKLFKGIYKWLFTVFATLLPQVVFLGSYLNNDSLALFSISIIIYSWILGFENNWNWKTCILMAVGLAICSLSYYNAYGYILCSVIIYCISCYIKKINFKEFFKKGCVIALIAFLLAGWWFIRNFAIYDGDFLGLKTMNEYSEKYAAEDFKPSNRHTPASQKISLKYMMIDVGWLDMVNKSFIGTFGKMTVYLKDGTYKAYNTIFLIGMLGALASFIIYVKNKFKNKEKLQKQDFEKILFNSIMIINTFIAITLSILYSYFSDYQAQGRYLMPMLIPFMYFITIGFQKIFDKIIKNAKVKNALLTSLILIWAIAPLYIYFNYIIYT